MLQYKPNWLTCWIQHIGAGDEHVYVPGLGYGWTQKHTWGEWIYKVGLPFRMVDETGLVVREWHPNVDV